MATSMAARSPRCSPTRGCSAKEYSQYTPASARKITAANTSVDSGLRPTPVNT